MVASLLVLVVVFAAGGGIGYKVGRSVSSLMATYGNGLDCGKRWKEFSFDRMGKLAALITELRANLAEAERIRFQWQQAAQTIIGIAPPSAPKKGDRK